MEVSEQAYFQAQAVRMAYLQADYLLGGAAESVPDLAASQAVSLITDCVLYLGQPALAVKLALQYQPLIERWSKWALWSGTLAFLLEPGNLSLGSRDRIGLLLAQSQAAREVGDFTTARNTADTAYQLARGEHDIPLQIAALNKLGLVDFRQDRLSDAMELWQSAYRLSNEDTQSHELAHLCLNMGNVLVHQGCFATAHAFFDQALQHYQRMDDRYHAAKVICNRANLYRREGHAERAPTLLREALAILDFLGARYEYGMAQNDLGCVYLSLEQFEHACSAFETALKVVTELNAVGAQALVMSNLAELYVSRQEWHVAATAIQSARDLAHRCGRTLLAAAVDVDYGRMLFAQGHCDRAIEVWQAVLETQRLHGASEAAAITARLLHDANAPLT